MNFILSEPHTTEAKAAQIQFLYELLLGRAPDADGLATWISQWTRSASIRDISEGIISSSEFIAKHPTRVKPSLDSALVKTSVNGNEMLVPLHDGVYALTLKTGRYETHVCNAIAALLKTGDCFLDIGANIGVHSLTGSVSVGPQGQVISVDASIDNCLVLSKTIRHFGIENILVVPCAVGAEPAIEYVTTDDQSSNKWVRKSRTEEGVAQLGSQAVLIQTIDTLLQKVSVVNLIKIDVEGREAGVLRGASELIKRSRCPIVAEYLGVQGAYAEGSFVEDLIGLGYVASVIEEGGGYTVLDGMNSLPTALSQIKARGGQHLDLLFRWEKPSALMG